MPIWKRNLFVCWIGVFIASIGMSEVALFGGADYDKVCN